MHCHAYDGFDCALTSETYDYDDSDDRIIIITGITISITFQACIEAIHSVKMIMMMIIIIEDDQLRWIVYALQILKVVKGAVVVDDDDNNADRILMMVFFSW